MLVEGESFVWFMPEAKSPTFNKYFSPSLKKKVQKIYFSFFEYHVLLKEICLEFLLLKKNIWGIFF